MNLLRMLLIALIGIFLTAASFAQPYTISGKILDGTDHSALIGATVVVAPVNDTAKTSGTVTDENGNFKLDPLPHNKYLLKVYYIGFETHKEIISLSQNLQLPTIQLKALSTQLKNVEVRAEAVRAIQSGDTTSFNANAYKVNRDATAEDLINKMPGISTQDGTLKAGGEQVKKVLVDGKPFFGDDPNAAIKNLPAEVIDKIQVFDKMSDQAQLTGFDDGNSMKTINIMTKPGRNNGQFGKLYGGIGARDFTFNNTLYLAGGNLNYFKGATRLSLLALSNNINQQNFSSDDLTGVMSANSGGMRGGPGGRGPGGPGGFGGGAGNFLVGQQGGITKTNSVGINYSDEWGKKIKVSGSYFFNKTDNENTTDLFRQYITPSDSGLLYHESSRTQSKNINHRANLRVEYEIDSNNTLIISPRVSFQQNEYAKYLTGTSTLSDSSLVSATNNTTTSNNTGINLSNNLTFMHRFAKKGRSLSFDANTQYNKRDGDGTLTSNNQYANGDSLSLDQRNTQKSDGYTLSGSLNYTEPLSKNAQLMVNYSPSFTKNNADKQTNNPNGSGDYLSMDTLLSNQYENNYLAHRGGLSYRYNNAKLRASVGSDYQYATLQGTQVFPSNYNLSKTFSNILPNAWLNYSFTKTKNLRMVYRASTNIPSVSQLQNVIDNSNTLLLRTGNTDLKQSYQHFTMMRYGSTNSTKATTFNFMFFGRFTQDYIANQTIIPTKDTLLSDGWKLNSGSQLTRPINMDGYININSFLSYGMPLKGLKTNLNLDAGVNYNRTPGMINQFTNFANNYGLNAGVVLSSNISENFDFTLAYNGSYNVVKNTLQKQLNNNYYSQNTSLRLNYVFLDGFVLNTSVNHQLYSGLSQGFNQNYLLWNAGLGYKFLKDRSLDVRVNMYDILNQNRAITRTITETYIEDSRTNILQRYLMLNVTYTIRKFGGKKISEQELEKKIDSDGEIKERQRHMQMMPPPPRGSSPHGGGMGF